MLGHVLDFRGKKSAGICASRCRALRPRVSESVRSCGHVQSRLTSGKPVLQGSPMIVIAVLLPWLALLTQWARISGGVLPGTPAYGAGMDSRRDLGCFGGQRRQAATPISRNASAASWPLRHKKSTMPTAAAERSETEPMETLMCPWRLGLLVLPIALAGCGGDKPKATLSVTCRRKRRSGRRSLHRHTGRPRSTAGRR